MLRAASHDRRRRERPGRRQRGGSGQRLRAGRPRQRLQPAAHARRGPDRRDRRRLRRPERREPTSPRTAASSACRPARRPTAASRKVNQTGATTSAARRANTGWAQEISLDLDMVSAICPNCKILLVEATQPDDRQPRHGRERGGRAWARSRLQQLRRLRELLGERATTPRTTSTPASRSPPPRGDERLRRRVPGRLAVRDRRRRHRALTRRATRAAGPRPSGRRWSEGAGSGCSAYETKPTRSRPTPAARGARSPTSRRSPTRPPASRSTTPTARGGWAVFGGTSVASPIIAAVYALADPPAAERRTRTRTRTPTRLRSTT